MWLEISCESGSENVDEPGRSRSRNDDGGPEEDGEVVSEEEVREGSWVFGAEKWLGVGKNVSGENGMAGLSDLGDLDARGLTVSGEREVVEDVVDVERGLRREEGRIVECRRRSVGVMDEGIHCASGNARIRLSMRSQGQNSQAGA